MKIFYNSTFFLLLLLCSCLKSSDFEDLKIAVNTSLPLGSLIMDDKRLFESISDRSLSYADDNVAQVVTNQELSIADADDIADIFSIENQYIAIDGEISDSEIVEEISITIPDGMSVDYELILDEDVVLEEVVFSRGEATLVGDSSEGYEGIVCRVEHIHRDGAALVVAFGESVDLTGYSMTPVDGAIEVIIEGEVVGHSSLDLSFNLQDMDSEYASGYFGTKELSSTQKSVNFEDDIAAISDNVTDFRLANPSVRMVVKSDVDIPLLAIVEEFTIDGTPLELSKGFTLDRFLITEQDSVITINNSNFVDSTALSNVIGIGSSLLEVRIVTIINPTPEQMLSDIELTRENSYRSSDRVAGDIEFICPIYGYFEGLNFNEKISMSLGSDITDQDYESISYAILATNDLPFDISLSLSSMTDGESMLLGVTSIPSAQNNVDPQVESIAAGVIDEDSYTVVSLGECESNSFIRADSLIFEIRATSMGIEQQQSVKLYRDVQLDIDMVIGLEGALQL